MFTPDFTPDIINDQPWLVCPNKLYVCVCECVIVWEEKVVKLKQNKYKWIQTDTRLMKIWTSSRKNKTEQLLSEANHVTSDSLSHLQVF